LLTIISLTACRPAANNPPRSSNLPGASATAGDAATTPQTSDKAEIPAPESPAPESVFAEEKLFDGWGKPDVVLCITGQQMGYIEPCGCTGLANQKGGLARRHTLVKTLKAKGWPVVSIDAGNQVRRAGRQAEIKFQIVAGALKKIGYAAVGLGVDDLRLSATEIVSITMEDNTPFHSANAALIDRSLTPRFRIAEAGGKRIGVTTVLGSDLLKSATSGDVKLQAPDEALAEVVPQLKEAKCDLLVLFVHDSVEGTKELAQQFPDFDIYVSADGHGDPTYLPESIEGTKGILIRAGKKAMFAGVVGLFEGDEKRLRYQRVPLDAQFADSPEMLETLAAYQDQLKELGLDKLGLSPIPHPSGHKFVGSRACADCHSKAFEIWKETPHARATDALVHPNERSQIPRHFDPECLSCHVTGWNPQKFFPYASGYKGLEPTPELVAVGCENCHGPGADHAAAESGDADVTEETIKTLREELRLPLAKAADHCRRCHDLDNDPNFQKEGAFEKYWPKIEHKGLD